MLAEAFCASDDKVRRAQAVLDEAQADRTRMLAAFAVTVGSDGGVADLMGLNEREVRLARRTVGKDDARSVAKRLFKPGAQAAPDPLPETQPETEPEPRTEAQFVQPVQSVPEQEYVPAPEPEYAPASPAAEIHLPHPRSETPLPGPSAGTYTSYHVPAASAESVTWSPAMDSVLLWSWQSGLDLQTVALELGLDTRELLLRAQTLAAEGRLGSKPMSASDHGQAGRHRRREEGLHVPVPDSPEGLYSFTPYG